MFRTLENSEKPCFEVNLGPIWARIHQDILEDFREITFQPRFYDELFVKMQKKINLDSLWTISLN